mgnify:FL=1
MSESILKSLLEESAKLQWAEHTNAPIHNFSKKHSRSMKSIFRLFNKNTCKSYTSVKSGSYIKFSRKTVRVLLLIIITAAVAGCTVTYFISQSFGGKVHNDNTELFALNTDNCPSCIEQKYYLTGLAEEYELLNTDSTPFYEYTSYKNKSTGQTILFRQCVKTEFDSVHYNTEDKDFEEIEINGHYGLCLEFNSNGYLHSSLIWDNGDYILELSGDLTKIEIINLAKSTKVYEY